MRLLLTSTAILLTCPVAAMAQEPASELEPIIVSNQSLLRDFYTNLGANNKLKLSGRPPRPIGTLGTCKIYRVQGETYVFNPYFMDRSQFYLMQDADYLVSLIESEISFVAGNW